MFGHLQNSNSILTLTGENQTSATFKIIIMQN